MISARTILECETKRLLKRVTNVVRQRIVGFDEDEANDLAVAQLWTIRQLLNPTDSAESAAERPGPATSPAGSGQPDLRSAPENSHSGDGADRAGLEQISRQLGALIDGYLAEATTDHREQITNLLGALRGSIALAYDLSGQLSDAKAELALMDDGMGAVHDRLDRAGGVPERVTAADVQPLAALLIEAVDCIEVLLMVDMFVGTQLRNPECADLIDRLRAAAAQIADTPN